MTAPATTAPAPAPAPAPAGTGLADTPVALLGRVPGRRLAAPALRAALAALATAPDRAAAERQVATAHGPAVAAERAALRSALLGDAFRPALAVGRPGDPVGRYLAAGEQQATEQEAAALESAVLEQFTRAMVRIGPPTAHTAVALGHWSADGGSLDRPGLDPARGRPVLALDRPQLAMAVDALSAGPDPAAGGPLPPLLRANWTLQLRNARAHFYRRDGEQLRLVSTAVTGKVRALLGLVELGPLPAEVLLRELAAGLVLTPEAAADLVAQAVRLQLLVGGSEFEGQDERPAAAAADFLTTRHPGAARLLTDVQERLDSAATSRGQQSADALAGLAGDQQGLNALLPHPVVLRVTEEHVLPPVGITATPHRAALDDLALVLEYAALSDPVHEARALLVAAFTERFGTGARIRLADCAADLVAVVGRRSQLLTPGTAADFGPADGSLTELLRLRAAARTSLGERIASGPAEVGIDPAELAALADGLPGRFRRTHTSYGVLVRPVGDRLAVRGYHPGGGSSALRYTGTDRMLGGRAHARLADRLSRAAGPAVLLEDRGLHGLDGNHRPPLLEDRIDPLGWLGLTLAHDPGTDTLELLDRDGAPVVVHSPALARPDRLAPPMRIALWLHGTGRLGIDPLGDAAADLRRTTGTLVLPRLTAGRVVLQGRRWYPGEDLPTATGPGLLCALADWRAAHDVPEELLLVAPRPAGPGVLGRSATAPDRTRYVDLGSALLAETVRELPAGGHLEEVPVGVQDGAHALEWILEYDRAPGGRFHDGAGPCG